MNLDEAATLLDPALRALQTGCERLPGGVGGLLLHVAATRPATWPCGLPATRAGRSRDADRACRRTAPQLLPRIRVPSRFLPHCTPPNTTTASAPPFPGSRAVGNDGGLLKLAQTVITRS